MNWAEKKAMAYQAIGLEAWYSNELVLAAFCFAEARKHASIAYQKEFEPPDDDDDDDDDGEPLPEEEVEEEDFSQGLRLVA